MGVRKGIGWPVGRWLGAALRAMRAFRLVDLEIDAGLMLGAHDSKQGADGLGRLALASDDLSHVLGIESERDQYSHLVA